MSEPGPLRPGRTLGGLFWYFLKLGSWGFGGPIALAGYMRRDLVEERQWYSEEEYQQGLAVAQTMPGPLAAQLAMWLGFLERGAFGALAVTVPFVVPPFLIVTVVAVFYARYQGLPWVEDVFFGVGPAVMAIIVIAAQKLARSTNKRDPVLWTVALILCLATALSGAEIVWLFLLAGAFGAVYYGGGLPRSRGRIASVLPLPLLGSVSGFAWTGTGAALGTMALFFIKAGAFTFGSGLAIVPFLHHGLVDVHHWLTEQQFTDAVAMGLISPGPVVIIATFAGYLVYGVVGAVVATLAVFLPVYLFVVVPGRWFPSPRSSLQQRSPASCSTTERKTVMKWVTRERPKTDRIACPWLIKKFIDPGAEFVYVPADQVVETASREGSHSYDAPGATYTHRDGLCSFEVLVEDYKIDDPAVKLLARIVHGADISDDRDATPQSRGLLAVAEGFYLLELGDDHRQLELSLPVYDALYAWCQHEIATA